MRNYQLVYLEKEKLSCCELISGLVIWFIIMYLGFFICTLLPPLQRNTIREEWFLSCQEILSYDKCYEMLKMYKYKNSF